MALRELLVAVAIVMVTKMRKEIVEISFWKRNISMPIE